MIPIAFDKSDMLVLKRSCLIFTTFEHTVYIPMMSTHLLMLLMEDLCDAALQSSELLIDVMQELNQVCSVQLTALYQHLQGEQRL